MSALVACAACHRHARVAEPACPFCGASLAGLHSPAVRRVSRRELTRTAVFAGAALLLGVGCHSDGDEREVESDGTGGGERSDGERRDFSSDRDTGEGRDTRVTTDETQEEVVVETDEDRERRRAQDEMELERDHRRNRHQGCDEPGCMAMPYGAPPSRDQVV